MAYTINSAKDSQGDEQLFLDDFNRNRVAIDAAPVMGDIAHA